MSSAGQAHVKPRSGCICSVRCMSYGTWLSLPSAEGIERLGGPNHGGIRSHLITRSGAPTSCTHAWVSVSPALDLIMGSPVAVPAEPEPVGFLAQERRYLTSSTSRLD